MSSSVDVTGDPWTVAVAQHVGAMLAPTSGSGAVAVLTAADAAQVPAWPVSAQVPPWLGAFQVRCSPDPDPVGALWGWSAPADVVALLVVRDRHEQAVGEDLRVPWASQVLSVVSDTGAHVTTAVDVNATGERSWAHVSVDVVDAATARCLWHPSPPGPLSLGQGFGRILTARVAAPLLALDGAPMPGTGVVTSVQAAVRAGAGRAQVADRVLLAAAGSILAAGGDVLPDMLAHCGDLTWDRLAVAGHRAASRSWDRVRSGPGGGRGVLPARARDLGDWCDADTLSWLASVALPDPVCAWEAIEAQAGPQVAERVRSRIAQLGWA